MAAKKKVVKTKVEYAGFWIRFAAHLLDSFILAVPAFILFVPFYIWTIVNVVQTEPTQFDPVFFVAFLSAFAGFFIAIFVIRWLYHAIFESSKWQATIGKRVCGIEVVSEKNERISFGRATGRHFAKILSSIFMIGFIMAAFTERKQGLHDIIAGTYCVYRKDR